MSTSNLIQFVATSTYASHKSDRAKLVHRYLSAKQGTRKPEMSIRGFANVTGRSVESVKSLVRFMNEANMIDVEMDETRVVFC